MKKQKSFTKTEYFYLFIVSSIFMMFINLNIFVKILDFILYSIMAIGIFYLFINHLYEYNKMKKKLEIFENEKEKRI